MLGVETVDELIEKHKNDVIDTMDEQDAANLTAECKKLKKQWDSIAVECHVTWKDGLVHLLRIRNTLVEFDGDAKIIQRMCQDITEERRQHENALMEVEQKKDLDYSYVIEQSDKAMYLAKERGKNTYHILKG